MFDLTPSERRGALVLLALVALGAVADLVRLEPAPAPAPAPSERPVAPAAGDRAAPVAGPAPSGAGGRPAAPAAPLDLNAASESELDALPGIGPVLAGRILAHRRAHGPFRSPDDLLAVPGIGPRLLERLLPHVTVHSARRPAGAVPRPRGPAAPADRTASGK